MIEAMAFHFVKGWAWGWTAVEAIATFILVAGIFLAYFQLRQTRKSTNAQIVLSLYKELRSEKAYKAIRSIYEEERESFVKFLSDNPKVQDIEYILDILGLVGALIDNKIIDKKMAIESFGGGTVLRCWYQLGEYIYKRIKPKRGTQFGRYFEDYAARVLKHWEKKNDDWLLFYRKIGDTPIPLLKEFKKSEILKPERLVDQPKALLDVKPEQGAVDKT